MSATTIGRKINYDMSTGDNAQLFDPIVVLAFPMFSLQFIVTAQAGAQDGELRLKVSNDGTNFKEITGSTIFPYAVIMDVNGDTSYYLFVGTGEGVGAVTHVTASFVKNGITAGMIEKVILCGNLGNA